MNDGADRVRLAEKRKEQRPRPKVGDGEKQSGLIHLPHDFSEEGINDDGSLGQYAPELEYPTQGGDDRGENKGEAEACHQCGEECHREGHSFKMV